MGKAIITQKKIFNAEVFARLEVLRRDRRLSARQLALRAGLAPAALTFLKQGERGLPMVQLQKLADVLRVPLHELVPNLEGDNLRVRVLGEISAGLMTPADAVALEQLEVPRSLLQTREDVFGLRVRGDSMEGAGIIEGDIGLFRTGGYAPGHLVAATLDGGTALRKFIHDGQRYWLMPQPKTAGEPDSFAPGADAAPSKYRPTEIQPDAEIKIWGVVIAIIRRLEGHLLTGRGGLVPDRR